MHPSTDILPKYLSVEESLVETVEGSENFKFSVLVPLVR
jgi:hypothetical protein